MSKNVEITNLQKAVLGAKHYISSHPLLASSVVQRQSIYNEKISDAILGATDTMANRAALSEFAASLSALRTYTRQVQPAAKEQYVFAVEAIKGILGYLPEKPEGDLLNPYVSVFLQQFKSEIVTPNFVLPVIESAHEAIAEATGPKPATPDTVRPYKRSS